MEKRLIILVALFVICSAASAFAAEPQWFGSSGPAGRDWCNPANWNAGAGPVPGQADRAKVNGVWGNPGPIISCLAPRVGEIFISEGPPELAPQTLTVAAGGEITTGSDGGVPYLGQVNIGYMSHNTGTLIMDGGTMNITQHLWLGWAGKGILQMNSGTLNTNGMFAPGWNGGSAEVHLDGGLLHTTQWWGGIDEAHLAWDNYTFDITEGVWEIHGWWVNELQTLKDKGQITGYGNPDCVIISWDEVREITTVLVLPEPITLSLLGMGALLLRRRS